MTFLALIAFSVYTSDIWTLHFYTGSILANLTLTSANVMPLSRSWKELQRWLAIALAILALFFGSFPDPGDIGLEGLAWLRVLERLGVSIFPSDCIFPPLIF